MMPTSIRHENWCTEHNDQVGRPLCVSDYFQFGPPDTSEHAKPDDQLGYVYLWQHEEDEQAELIVYYPTKPHVPDATLSLGVARQLVTALDADPDGTLAALRAALDEIDKENS